MDKKALFLLFLILVMQFALRLPFLGEPLQYDEGVYGYAAQRVLDGGVPYRDFFDHKPPAIYYTYAFIIKLFGGSPFSIRLLTAFIGLIATIFIFLIGRKMFSDETGLLSALLYAIFSGGVYIQGTGSNTENFMVLFMVMGLYFLISSPLGKFMNSPSSFLAGLFSGIAFMFKPVALLNFIPLLLFSKFRRPLLLGFLTCPLFFAVYFFFNRALSDFIKCAFIFNSYYADYGGIVSKFALIRFLQIAIYENSVLWFFAAIGLKNDLRLLNFWALASLLGVCATGYYFDHYFVQVIPALALLGGVGFWKLLNQRSAALILAFALFLNAALAQYQFYTDFSPDQITFYRYRGNLSAAAALKAAGFLKDKIAPSDYLVARGYPQTYYYLGAKYPGKFFYGFPSCTGEIYTSVNLFNLLKIDDRRILTGRIPKVYLDRHSEEFTAALLNPKTRWAVQTVDPVLGHQTALDYYAGCGLKFYANLPSDPSLYLFCR